MARWQGHVRRAVRGIGQPGGVAHGARRASTRWNHRATRAWWRDDLAAQYGRCQGIADPWHVPLRSRVRACVAPDGRRAARRQTIDLGLAAVRPRGRSIRARQRPFEIHEGPAQLLKTAFEEAVTK